MVAVSSSWTRRAVSVLLVVLLRCAAETKDAQNETNPDRKSFDTVCQEYNAYFTKAPSPLKKVSDQPRLQCALAKGAEFAVDEFSAQAEKKYDLRRLVKLNQIEESSYSLLLLVQARGPTWELRKLEAEITIFGNWQNGSWPTFSASVGGLLSLGSGPCGDERSKAANCTHCNDDGHCEQGKVPVDPWLSLALSTQVNLQHKIPLDNVQLLAAHNAFNARASGYGEDDDCRWPPPYDSSTCVDLANQEFTFTDLLNMGVRSMEIDPWWCFLRMRMSHADDHWYLGCAPWDRELGGGLAEIGQWLANPANKGEIVRIYFEDGPDHTQGHDDDINNPIKEHIGNFAFTPAEQKKIGVWPTMEELRAMNKSIFFVTDSTYTHGGVYVHQGYNGEMTEKEFSSKPPCGGVVPVNHQRVYCDSTHYGPFWDGPEETGVILDYSRFMKCRVLYPAADQVGPDLLRTAVFTWNTGQPSAALTTNSCVALLPISNSTFRWSIESCSSSLRHACQNQANNELWTLSNQQSVYKPGAAVTCPSGYVFSIPEDGYQNEQVVTAAVAAGGQGIWLNWYEFASSADYFLKKANDLIKLIKAQ